METFIKNLAKGAGAILRDYAGPALIIQQAGGKVTDVQGKLYSWNSKSIVGANKTLHAKIIKELAL